MIAQMDTTLAMMMALFSVVQGFRMSATTAEMVSCCILIPISLKTMHVCKSFKAHHVMP